MAFSTHITRRLSPAEVFRKRTKSTTYSAEMWYLSTAQYYEYPMWYLSTMQYYEYPMWYLSTIQYYEYPMWYLSTIQYYEYPLSNHCCPTADHRAAGCSIHRLNSMREAVLTAGLGMREYSRPALACESTHGRPCRHARGCTHGRPCR